MSIKARIHWFTVGSVLVTAVLIMLITYTGFRAMLANQLQRDLQRQVQSESRRLELSFHEILHDVTLLASLPSVQTLAAQSQKPGMGARPDILKNRIAEVFSEMVRAKNSYGQIRFIGTDDDGREIVRVDRRNEIVARTPEKQLQHKANRRYFKEILATPAGQIYLSSINLNREFGRIEVPHRPVLRAAIRVDSAPGVPFGFVIINVDFNRFLKTFLPNGISTAGYYMTNSSGDFIYHPDESRRFGFDLGNRNCAQEEFPEVSELFDGEAPDLELNSAYASFIEDRAICFEKVHLFPNDPARFITLGIEATGSEIVQQSKAISRNALFVTAALAAVSLIVTFLATRFLFRPVEQVTEAARRLTRGESYPALPSSRDDEIGVLAGAFETMATSIRQKEREVLDVNKRLAATNEDLEHFVHIAAHDLREPLRKQRNFIDLLRVDGGHDFDSESQQFLDHVYDCSIQMQDMVDAFRALTKLGYGNLVREWTNLRSLIDQCVTEMHDEITERNVQLRYDDFPERINIYPSLVRQLYLNLIRNALVHVAQPGFTLRFTAECHADSWTFGVSNSGSSIPDDQRDEIFQIFRKSSTHRSGGTGVGLSICKRIVERHRGQISVDSTDNEVHFRFTLGDSPNETRERSRDHHRGRRRHGTVAGEAVPADVASDQPVAHV